MRFGILGPLEVADEGGRKLELGGRRQRAVLAILLLHPNEVVSSDRLVEDLWSGGAPASAVSSLQAHVSRLRRALGAERRIVTVGGGYLVRVAPGELDRDRFEQLVEEGGAAVLAEGWELASAKLRDALGLWRGAPLSEFQYESFAQAEIARLEEVRLGAVEQRVEAELALGREGVVIGELEGLVREHPYRERLWGQLMLALYRTGRQAEALAAYGKARSVLVEELGIEPSSELRGLHEAVLGQDRSLLRPGAGVERAKPERMDGGDGAASPLAEEAPPAREDTGETTAAAPVGEAESPRRARKVVTALFCDVTGSTSLGEQLDPEVLRGVLGRYFAEIRGVIERHGGTVEKFIGDAVMAVFGIPRVHEDDALRAVRAAAEIRERLPAVAAEVGVELRFRMGVNTGLVLMAEGEHLVVGDAVNVAARLERAAAPGEILIGEETRRLVRDAVVVEEVEPLELRGKAQRVAACRLVSVDPAAPGFARHLDVPLVGREDELRLLREVWDRARRESGCYLFTLLGMAGVGKSRLVGELLAGITDHATVLQGRCLPYGEGITFWPLVEALTAVGERAARVLEQLRSGGVATREELFWEVRRLLEALAAERPVVLHIDDLQWAEPTLLDLLDHVADLSRGAPILVLCTARPELLEDRPGWGGGKLNAVTLLLEPLAAAECEALLDRLGNGLDPDARARVIAASQGNPLFLEEMAALARERGTVEVPPTIQALLAARLERLPDPEREVLERGAVEGEVFHRLAVRALADDGLAAEVDRHLAALVRKELIRPHPPTLAGDEAFRFRHLLIRDAAYDTLPKSRRAELHERFAAWLEHTAGTRLPEFEEIVGYHLELAYRYARLLRGADADSLALAARASRCLESAGRRAMRRNDLPAAIGLLERASTLPADDDPLRATLLVDLAAAQIEAGKLTKAKSVLVQAGQLAAIRHDACASAHVEVQRQFLQLEEGTGQGTNEAKRVVESVLPVFEGAGDHLGLSRALRLRAYLCWIEARAATAARAWEEAAEHARLAGAEHERIELLTWVASSLFFGPTPVDQAITTCEQIRAEVSADAAAEAATLHPLAGLHAMAGRFALARELLTTSRDLLEDIDPTLNSAVSHPRAIVEMLAGDPAAAEAYLRADSETLDEMKDEALLSTALLSTTDAFRARALLEQERDDEAEHYTRLSERRAATSDLVTQIIWRSVRARVLARRGSIDQAEQLARQAVDLAKQTDFLNLKGDALLDLAHILHRAGRLELARARGAEALRCYQQKGNSVAAARAGSLLTRLSDDVSTGSGSSPTVAAGPVIHHQTNTLQRE